MFTMSVKEIRKSIKYEIRTCVYCLKYKRFHQDGPKGGSKFNKEHVIQKALASVEDNLTIVGAVCSACNTSFSKQHDLWLTRRGKEGVYRFPAGLKSFDKFKELNQENIRLLPLDPSREPEFRPEWKLVPKDGLVSAVSKAGAYLIRGKDDRLFVPLSEIDTFDFAAHYGEGDCEIYIPENDDCSYEQVVELLKRRGVLITEEKTSVTFGHSPAILDFQLDLKHVRAYAKIAFNFFIWSFNSAGSNFPWDRKFDPVRTFIRNGDGDPERFFRQSGFKTRFGGKDLPSHCLRLFCEQRGNLWALAVHGTLFNDPGWTVTLADDLTSAPIKEHSFTFAWLLEKRLCLYIPRTAQTPWSDEGRASAVPIGA